LGRFVHACRTPSGPAATAITGRAPEVEIQAWGPGAGWILDHAPSLLGLAGTEYPPVETPHPVVAGLLRRFEGLTIPRSLRVMEALVPSILEQKVTGREAHGSYRRLVLRFGEPAPGPLELFVPPSPETLAALPYHEFHPLGIERKRADTIRRACSVAGRLEEISRLDPRSAEKRLTSVPGIGRWTAAEVARVALGDADAVSVDDYNLPHLVTWILAGERRGTDERMLELLEPYAGQRGRVARMLEIAGPRPPRRGSRHRLRHIERI
jgi:3-methyladenine DNA glycosylase/8-oxoguanine DNA glycosylase